MMVFTASVTQRESEFYHDVVDGLSRRPRRIPCKYFYDQRGSVLFDRICELDEYYLTRTEIVILRKHVDEIRLRLCPRPVLFELGSGSSIKTRILLDNLDVDAYVPMDISGEHLKHVVADLARAYPRISIYPLVGDYSKPYALPEPVRLHRCVVAFFPGSTIGNLPPDSAKSFLRRIWRVLPSGGSLLIGVDLVKDSNVLIRAYDDSAGVTAEFNRNLLHRMQAELGADVPLDAFAHEALFNAQESRVEMHLVATRPCAIELDGRRFPFNRGDRIHTENSYKYSLDRFSELAAQARFTTTNVWTDPARLFSVQLLRKRN